MAKAALKISVFMDWENIWQAATRAFDVEAINISPLKLGNLLANKRDEIGTLVSVEVNRGLPSPRREPERYTEAMRQAALWQKEAPGVVSYHLRPLRYRKHRDGAWVGEEKGVDVRVAASAIRSILKRDCDVAILFSHDSDLSPVVEILSEIEGPKCIETVSWRSSVHRQRIPEHPGVWNHYLTEADLQSVLI